MTCCVGIKKGWKTMTYSVTLGIPYYQRPTLVRRCLDAIEQANKENRINVVLFDDGSPTKFSASKSYSFDLHVIRSDLNVGVCEGRRALINAATNDLFMIIDSDDTIPSNFLDVIDSVFTPEIDGVLFKCQWDDGTLSPARNFPDGTLGVKELLRFMQINPTRRLEWRSVVKTATRDKAIWPAGHRKMERYHLDLVSHYQVIGSNKVIRNYHTDADDQISKTRKHGDRSERVEIERMLGTIEFLNDYGSQLKKYSPKRYWHQKLYLIVQANELKRKNKSSYVEFVANHRAYFGTIEIYCGEAVFLINRLRRLTRRFWPI